MSTLAKRLEVAANVAIITVAVLLGTVLVTRFLLPSGHADPQAAALIQPGAQVQLPGVDWSGSGHTLVLALSTGCHFCSESAGFYQRIAQAKTNGKGARMIAVLPQPLSESKEYLSKLGVAVDDVKQAPLSAVGARGTPTLILVDDKGMVQEMWVGKLPPAKEGEVMDVLRADSTGR